MHGKSRKSKALLNLSIIRTSKSMQTTTFKSTLIIIRYSKTNQETNKQTFFNIRLMSRLPLKVFKAVS